MVTQIRETDVVNLVSDLAGKQASGAYLTSPIAESDVTNLTTDLAAKQVSSAKDQASGYAGLNSSSRTTKGVVTTDDVIINLATKGLVLLDTQGTPHYWRLSVSTLGVLTTTDLGTVLP